MLKIYLLLIIFDTLTGITAAVINKELKSSTMYVGIIKLIIEILAIAIFILATTEIPEILAYKMTVLTILLLKETISIIENLGRIGILVPQQIINMLPHAQINKENNNEK